jgi:hypothetical protein
MNLFDPATEKVTLRGKASKKTKKQSTYVIVPGSDGNPPSPARPAAVSQTVSQLINVSLLE